MDRNFILALVMTGLIFLGWDFFVLGPQKEALAEQRAAAEQARIEQGLTDDPGATGDTDFLSSAAPTPLTREDAIASSAARLPIETPELTGSINLTGLTFDDITLKNYDDTVHDESAVVLLTPQQTDHAQYMRSGLAINGQSDRQAQWTIAEGETLTPATPVTLTRTVGSVEHAVRISVDDKFMFAVDHKVTNNGSDAAVMQPYGASYQRNIPDDLQNMMILFEGPLGVVGDRLYDRKYKQMLKKGSIEQSGTGGWVGITDKYWLSAVIPPQDRPFRAKLDVQQGASPLFRSTYELDPISVAPGETMTITSHLFAGAKVVEVLRDYEAPIEDGGLGIQRFDMAVDWGNFFFLTRPIFNTLHFFHGLVGNYGIAILLLTLVIKAILFPLANMSFKSMAGMKKAQPEMQKIRERYGDDRMKQQQEMMALYKKHNINVAAGCLPMLAQMPIFYALYKTLFTTIEMRHEPFLYIKDLSQRDPTTIFNLFGILPFDPTTVPYIGSFLGIGVLPLIMGACMWVQMKLNPPPADKTQAQIFAFMPLIFLFMFAPFAAGLVLYWAWNTFLGVVQQYTIMKRNGADVDLIGNIKDSLGLNKPKAANENSK
ncbi:membrane protein insertase YidC [Parvularcula sp. LCG005]|uniref:membrane protein insertase YidC n=1 Tax=Parvularcula sp. LCG005 TaxID=3078805 RepID=UPI002942A814|nr:membrane protein insertase YidC [Parvularcula sp. LCG005]WOI52067.1 membrane protein insertase YidC [Parvularcula sp. LCG005]